MVRSLTAFLPVGGDPVALGSVLAGDPGVWLPPPAEASGPDGWIVVLRAGPARHAVLCGVGASVDDTGNLWRPLAWNPHGALGRLVDRALPDFVGELGLLQGDSPTLVLTGGYQPPGGQVGTAGDIAGLHLLAEVSARRFLEDVSQRLRASVRSR